MIRLSHEKDSKQFEIPTYNSVDLKEDLKLEKIALKNEKSFEELTVNGKYCLLFLICSVLSKRTCLLQGETCSGKSFLIKFLSEMLGQKLIIYQMNCDTGMSLYSGDKIINETLSSEDTYELSNIIEKIKKYIEIDNNIIWDIPQYKKIINNLENEIKSNNNKDIKNTLIEAKNKISLIISPVNQFNYHESEFIKALKNGNWVLIDGIDLAPNEIIEKLLCLCGDNREFNIYESDDGIYIDERKINKNFHLFLTCNPYSDGAKKIERVLFNKCNVFTSPQIDSSPEDTALVLFSSIDNDEDKKLLNAQLSERIANVYTYCLEKSKKNPEYFAGDVPLTPRNILFDSNVFKYSGKDKKTENIILSILEHNYFNSYHYVCIASDTACGR